MLEVIADFVRDHLPESFEMTTDLPDCPYNFPLAITPTDLRPDIVLWSKTLQSATLVELTVCYETRTTFRHKLASQINTRTWLMQGKPMDSQWKLSHLKLEARAS